MRQRPKGLPRKRGGTGDYKGAALILPTADGALYLRNDLKNRAIIRRLINFNELKIFDSAKGQHNMVTIIKKGYDPDFTAQTCITKIRGDSTPNILNSILSWQNKQTEYYSVKQKHLFDGDKNYIRIQGSESKEGGVFEEVLKKIKQNSTPLIKIKNINQGILTGVDKVADRHIKKFNLKDIHKGEGVYIISNSELEELKLNENEKKTIKPHYKNSDIFRYFTKSVRDKENLIYATRDLEIENYPNIKKHLFKYEQIIKARSDERGEMQAALKLGKWWVIFAARPDVNFESQKIVCPQRSPRNTFGYNNEPWYACTDVYFITNKKSDDNDLKYILALLNSKLMYIWLYFRGKRKGELLELLYQPLTEIPIKEIPLEKQIPFIQLVDQILFITKDDDYLDNWDMLEKVRKLEKEIDQLVYKLFDLISEEIETVEMFCKEKM